MGDDRRSVMSRRRLLGVLVLPSIALWIAGPALARRGRGRGGRDDDGEHGGGDHHDDYEQARTAVGTGEALPLSEIVIEVKKVIDGDVLDVELQKTPEGLRYTLRLLSRAGTYHRVTVDAKSKIIVKIEQQ